VTVIADLFAAAMVVAVALAVVAEEARLRRRGRP
jgi:hypothetical protein